MRECGWARTIPRAVWLGILLFLPALEPGDLRLCGSCLGAQRSGNWPSPLGGWATWQLQGLELEEALAIIQGLFWSWETEAQREEVACLSSHSLGWWS